MPTEYHLHAVIRDENGVLELRRQTAIHGGPSPSVLPLVRARVSVHYDGLLRRVSQFSVPIAQDHGSTTSQHAPMVKTMPGCISCGSLLLT